VQVRLSNETKLEDSAWGEEIVDSFETASELVAAPAGEFSIVQACIKIEIRMHNHKRGTRHCLVWNVGRARRRSQDQGADCRPRLLIVSASERQQIAARSFLAPTSGARRQSSMSRPAKRGRCPTPMKARPRG
jgi:hypothetical protein